MSVQIPGKIEFGKIDRSINPTFRNLLRDRARYMVLKGGAGSGKSRFVAQKIIYRLFAEKGHRFLVARKVYRTLRESCAQELLAVANAWGLRQFLEVNTSPLAIRCPLTGGEIVFLGLDDVEKVKSISGITSIWIEEATELSQKDFQQLTLRLRGRLPNYKQVILTFNPIDATHWIKRLFWDTYSLPWKMTRHESTYEDNRYLPADDRAQIESFKDIDALYHQVYALGQWGDIRKTAIYTNWEVGEAPPLEVFGAALYGGQDFGFNDPSVFLLVGYRDETIYVLREVYETKLTNAELIERVKTDLPPNVYLCCDSAEPARIVEFTRAGIKALAAAKGKGSVNDGIDYLKRRKIVIDRRCTNTLREIQAYKWREDRDGRVLDEPAPLNDHAMDALRYAVEPLRLSQHRTDFAITRGAARVG